MSWPVPVVPPFTCWPWSSGRRTWPTRAAAQVMDLVLLNLRPDRVQIEHDRAVLASFVDDENCGMIVAAKTAMMITTINTSISVNAFRRRSLLITTNSFSMETFSTGRPRRPRNRCHYISPRLQFSDGQESGCPSFSSPAVARSPAFDRLAAKSYNRQIRYRLPLECQAGRGKQKCLPHLSTEDDWGTGTSASHSTVTTLPILRLHCNHSVLSI